MVVMHVRKEVYSKHLYYEVTGTGPPLLFLHGLGMGRQVWEPIINQLKNDNRCISLDLHGFGKNKAPEELQRIPFSRWIVQIKDILEELCLDNIHLVGHSLGSFIALAFAAKYPSQCLSVTGISTLPEFNETMTNAFEQRALRVEKLGLGSIIDDLVKGGFSSKTLQNNQDIVEKYKSIVSENSSSQYALCCRSIANLNNHPILGNISTPVQLIVGLDDKITPPSFAEIVSGSIVECKMYTLEDCGHQIHMENRRKLEELEW
jgi:3-oxoadipate enol-lactonase